MNKIRKIVIAGLMSLGMIGGITSYAAEGQSTRWEGSGDVWKVKTQDGRGYLVNSWFQDDVSGYWYMLGADGGMFSGLVTDNSTGKTYLMNINHDGSFGRMVTENGVYNEINLTFNQAHDGTYGAIISGLDELRNAGINETKLNSIPSDNGGNSGSSSENQEQVEDNNVAPVDGEIRTFKNGITKQYVAAANCWITIDNGTGEVVDGFHNNPELARKIGENMVH